jgi:hypothetical protein
MFARALLPLAGLALSGCFTMQQDLTPWQRCLYYATSEYRALRLQVQEAQANLARGYRLVPRDRPRLTVISCPDNAPWGSCLADTSRRDAIPVSIDPEDEQARLDRLNAKIAALRPAAAERAYAACGPEP